MPAKLKPGTRWVEVVETIHGTCENCGERLERHFDIPGIRGGITWFHPSTSYMANNGFDCPEEAKARSANARTLSIHNER